MMALVLTVLGMLMYFGTQGLPDPAARAFVSHPMFRPGMAGQPRALLAGASSRLDPAALDALLGMEAMNGHSPDDGRGSEAAGRGGRHPRQWFSSRPW